MTVRERILALRLLEKGAKQPEYTQKIGIRVTLKPKDRQKTLEDKNG